MGRVADRLAEGGVLHLDWLAYATALIGNGRLDWGDAAAVAALYGKAQALLPSDLVVLPLEPAIAAYVAAHPALVAAMAAKPRGAQPLRALLADAGLRGQLSAMVTGVARATAPALLAVSVADPAGMAQQAAALAGVAVPPADADLADDAAVYLADALRGLADTPLAAIVITDGNPDLREFLAPVRKVAAHYGWDVGGADLDFAIAPHPLGEPLPAAAFATVIIPAGGQPEAVLAAVTALRKAMS